MTNKSRRNRARQTGQQADTGPVWLWGVHAVAAALSNPRRAVLRRLATDNAARRLSLPDAFERVTAKSLDADLPSGAVHQGVAILCEPLEPESIEDLAGAGAPRLAVLDQVEDPRNLGAVFRSAAAFGVAGLVLQTRHAPRIGGLVAKAAAGGVEAVAECRVVNIARSIEALKEAGYFCVGLAGEGEAALESAVEGANKVAVVLGAEGAGLRPAVAKACDTLARIDISPAMESLNVSAAAAIAFYAAERAASRAR